MRLHAHLNPNLRATPNAQPTDIAPASSVKIGVSPLAFFVGPVHSVFDADPAGTVVGNLEEHILDD